MGYGPEIIQNARALDYWTGSICSEAEGTRLQCMEVSDSAAS